MICKSKLSLFVLILLVSGSACSAVKTKEASLILAPLPRLEKTLIYEDKICLDPQEAGELLIWIEYTKSLLKN